jgi:tRNA A-37 threonylcarbamoyl transferase component Bud32
MNAIPEHQTDLTGRTLMGKLQVLRLLGEGGMGAVYEVEHLITRHHRALKVMHQRYAASTETVARFIREAGVAGTLKTPHVVETYDAGQLEDGSPYVLMELLSGTTFAALVDSGAQLSPGRVVGIVCQVLEGLAVAHDAGIVHRDIKPDNIFVSEDDRGRERVRILDFGISKFATSERNSFSGAGFDGTLTSDHTVMGTPYYMSPEQATGAKLVDERSDIYSIGVMLYEGLSGVRPFEAQNMAQLIIKIHAGEYPKLLTVAPHVSPALAEIVEKSMHHHAGERFAGARELLAALLPHAESNYTSSLQTLREVPKDGPIAPAMASPRRVDVAAHTLAAHTVAAPAETLAATPPPRAWLVPALVVALFLALGAGSFFAYRATGDALRTPPAAVTPEVASPPSRPIEVEVEEVVAPAAPPAAPTGVEAVEAPVEAPRVRPHPPRREVRESPPAETSAGGGSEPGTSPSSTGRRRILRDGY